MAIPILKIKDKQGNEIPIDAIRGEPGKSAYELALDNGFVGTEDEWLKSLEAGPINSEDKEEIVAHVLAELPKWNGGSY